jgi:hypothetical protein
MSSPPKAGSVNVKVVGAAELNRMDRAARDRDAAFAQANPEAKMPVFVSCSDPQIQIHWPTSSNKKS